MEKTFEKFDCGRLLAADRTIPISSFEWRRHPVFEGVELKDIISADDTGGQFSYHLVRIAPRMKIETHIHADQTETHEIIGGSGVCISGKKSFDYSPGTVSMIEAGTPHEIAAGEDGLCLFAKFIALP